MKVGVLALQGAVCDLQESKYWRSQRNLRATDDLQKSKY